MRNVKSEMGSVHAKPKKTSQYYVKRKTKKLKQQGLSKKILKGS